MGDSDDEYDRRRGRDKFRRERNDYNDRPAVTRRDDWPERSEPGSNWNGPRDRPPIPRRDYRDGGFNSMGGGRMSHGRSMDPYASDRRDISPPSKRMRGNRGDYDDRYPNYELGGVHYNRGNGGHYGGDGYHRGGDGYAHERERDDELYQPPMLTLKQFLNDQDDMIDEETLIKKYNDYKISFKRTQIQEFFNRHKDEEWFRSKYFPDEIEKRKERQKQTNQNRLAVFMDLYEKGWLEGVSLDVDKSDQIARLLDAAVIKLEGGSDFDLKSLDESTEEAKVANKDVPLFSVEDTSSMNKASLNEDELQAETEDKKKSTVAAEESGDDTAEVKSKSGELGELSQDDNSGDGELMEEGEAKHSRSNDETATAGDDDDAKEEKNKPRPLHKTCSIFFRNLIPTITRQEVEDECKKFAGFLRLALSEPQMDRRFIRRGWATYERTANIREICWVLSSIKLKGTDIGPIVNRDLARRIRSVIGLTSHKAIVRADIRHAAKLIMKLDAEKGLWQQEAEKQAEDGAPKNNGTTTSTFMAPSRNPLLKNITEYLIEEAPAEEAALLGASLDDPLAAQEVVGEADTKVSEENGEVSGEGTKNGASVERDEELVKVLDRLLFYLRVVHSFDYYTLNEYPNEDEMPNRIGLIHARGLFSSSRVTPTEIADYLKEMELKIAPLLEANQVVSNEEAQKLGLKEVEEAIEAFIKENTKELGEGKWLCPLSNKKFMGPEFVRKHIINKHSERIEQVQAETHYFNNYVLDPKRPQLPEHPLNRPPQHQQQQQQQPQPQQNMPQRDYGRDMGDYGRYGLGGGYARPAYGHVGAGGAGGGRYSLSPYPQAPLLHDNYQRGGGGGGGGLKRNRSEMLRDAVDYDDVNVDELI